MVRLVAILVTATWAGTAAAQGPLDDLGAAATEAVEVLRGAAEDRLLIGDVLGSELSGPSGETIGTVENFAAIPGGRIVAVVVAMNNGQRIAVPWQVVSVSRAADSVGLEVPVSADGLLHNAAVEKMSSLLGL